jgi:hypothetical protein
MDTVMIDVLDEDSLTDETTWVRSRRAPPLPPVLLAAIAASREERRAKYEIDTPAEKEE